MFSLDVFVMCLELIKRMARASVRKGDFIRGSEKAKTADLRGFSHFRVLPNEITLSTK